MSTQDDGFISTSRLVKDLGFPVSSVFEQLRQLGLIENVGDKAELTEAGKQRGGRYMSSQKYGTWIAWPKDVFKVESVVPGVEAKPFAEAVKEHQQTATALGRTFGIPATRMNYILSELGWIQKSLKQAIYAKYGFNLIDFADADVLNLDDILPAKLLK